MKVNTNSVISADLYFIRKKKQQQRESVYVTTLSIGTTSKEKHTNTHRKQECK